MERSLVGFISGGRKAGCGSRLSEGETPLTAFSLKNDGAKTSNYLDIAGLEPILRGQDKSAASGGMMVITGSVTPAGE